MQNQFHIIALAIILVIVFSIFLVWPKYQDLQALQLEVQQKEKEFQSKKEYFDSIRDSYQELENRKEMFAKIDNALPNQLSTPSIFHYLQKVAREGGLRLTEIGLGCDKGIKDSPLKPSIKEISLGMSLSGSYDPNLKRFLSTIENSARLFQIERVYFSSPEDSKTPFSFEINLKAHGY